MTIKPDGWKERLAWQKEKVKEYRWLRDIVDSLSGVEYESVSDPLGFREDIKCSTIEKRKQEAIASLLKFEEEVLPKLQEYEESEQFDVDVKLYRLEWLRNNKGRDFELNREHDELVAWKQELKGNNGRTR